MKYRKQIWLLVFALYCAAMAFLLFGREEAPVGIPYAEQIAMRMNLVPFRTLRLFTGLLSDHRPHLVQAAVVNLFGNVLMFLPLGFLLPLTFRKLTGLWKILLATASLITAVELLQLFTLVGSCDIDDLILNTLGCMAGYGIYVLIKKIGKKGMTV